MRVPRAFRIGSGVSVMYGQDGSVSVASVMTDRWVKLTEAEAAALLDIMLELEVGLVRAADWTERTGGANA